MTGACNHDWGDFSTFDTYETTYTHRPLSNPLEALYESYKTWPYRKDVVK